MRKLILALLLLFAPSAWAQCTAGLDPTSVQNAINAAAPGATVTLPAGSCTWTSGVSISGKGIHVQGAGSGRIVGYSLTALTLTTGAKSITITPANAAGTMPLFSNGQALVLKELAFVNNFLQGTVTSFNSSTGALSLNITSVGGTCGVTGTEASISNCARWLVSTEPSVNETKLINNVCATAGGCASAENGSMFSITVDGSVNTSIKGIHFASTTAGNGPGNNIVLNTNGSLGPVGGKSVVIQNNMFELGIPSFINSHTTQAVISNNSFVDNRWQSQFAAIRVVDSGGNIGNWAWTTPSFWGTADTTGQNNLYFETNDVEGLSTGTDFDSGARAVYRYNYVNETTIGTHGAETSPYGMRYVEFYNNVFVHESNAPCVPAGCPPGFPDSDFSLANGWINQRGGSIVWWNNIIPQITGGYPKGDFALQMQMLNRHGVHSCWGIGTTGGANYYAPRQVGMGRVTGTGSTSGVDQSCTAAGNPAGCSATNFFGPASADSFTYVGDSEPLYIWGNGRSIGGAAFTPSLGVGGTNSGTTGACTNPPNPDDPNNYVKLGRDYFMASNETLGSTIGAKPGYAPFTYPHPLISGGITPPTPPAPPTGLSGTVSASTVSLSWTASAGSPTPTAYTLYRGTVHGGPYSIVKSGLTTTSTTDTPPNGTWFYTVTGYVGGIITNIVGNGTTATVTCTTNCTFPNGALVAIGGNSITAFNVTTTSTGQPNSSSFTFASSTAGTGTGGGAWQTASESAKSNEITVGVPASLTVTLLPASRTFANQIVGTSSSSQTAVLTNTSGAGNTVTISSKSLTGANSGDYSFNDNCPSLLMSGLNCTFNLTFTPTAAGTRVATLTVVDNAAGQPHTVALSGTGVAQTPGVSLNPTSLNFGDQTLSTTSTVRSIILTNTGSGVLTISSVVASGDFAVVTVPATNCGGTLASLATCSLNVTFTPTATGGRTGAVTVTDNASGSPHVATLSGNGITTKCQATGNVTLSGVGTVCP